MIATLRAVAHPWLCDAMGHMNVRHYLGMFDDASWHFLAELGHAPKDTSDTGIGWADVRHTIEYKDEVSAGALVMITSRVIKVGRTSLTYCSQMTAFPEGPLHATIEITTVAFDLNAREAVPLPHRVRLRAEAMLAVA